MLPSIHTRSTGRLAPTKSLDGLVRVKRKQGIDSKVGMARSISLTSMAIRGASIEMLGAPKEVSRQAGDDASLAFGGEQSMAADEHPAAQVRSVSKVLRDRSKESLGAKASRLAKKHRLAFDEVKNVLQHLDKVDKHPSGYLTKPQFADFLRRVFHIDRVPEHVLDAVYRTANRGEGQEMDLESFLDWYMMNIFTLVAQLQADPKLHEANSQIEELARRFGVPQSAFNRIRKLFDKFDQDRSGNIDYNEFEAMLMTLVGAGKGDFSKERMMKFWREIDTDASGEVDFGEFSAWYMKYFAGDDPTAAFYASFNPSRQRQNAMEAMEWSNEDL